MVMCCLSVFLHIVEEVTLRNTKHSCVPSARAFPQERMAAAFFETEAEFETAMREAFERMHRATEKPALRHLLIISAHGKQGTGTHVRLERRREAFDLRRHAAMFEMRPREIVVFISACWGAYPSIVQAVRSGVASPKPITIGPIVNIHPKHANLLQRRIVKTMCEERDIEGALAAVTQEESAALFERHGEAVWRIIKRDGTSIPPQGKAGLAVPMRAKMSYRIVALQRLQGSRHIDPDVAVLLSADGKYWRAPITPFEQWSDGTAYNLIGKSFLLRAKELCYQESAGIGDLVDFGLVSLQPHPPRFFRAYRPPYDYSVLPSTTKYRGTERPLSVTALPVCKRCNWSTMHIRGTSRDGLKTYFVDGLCHRDTCPQHGPDIGVGSG